MPLLSLDVGFANLGWALWDQGKLKAMGVIVTKKATKKSTRTADDYSFRSTYNLQFTYVVNGYKFGATMFEHIADAIGAYWALRDGNLVKLFG